MTYCSVMADTRKCFDTLRQLQDSAIHICPTALRHATVEEAALKRAQFLHMQELVAADSCWCPSTLSLAGNRGGYDKKRNLVILMASKRDAWFTVVKAATTQLLRYIEPKTQS
eukprot:GHUV01029484.1.p1 GENE.GHUV01029484.1~~GHUV01029484.1.p1  ORF type:complete len:113 (+),score=26.24 GHUV01029484.1:279-617(+)